MSARRLGAKNDDGLGLVRLGQEGDRARRIRERLDGIASVLEGAVRRSLPYLVRQKISVTALAVRTELFGDLLASFEMPRYVMPLRAGARGIGALVLDGNAVARGLDGVLGGKGNLAALDPSGLSAAQTALASRLARGLVTTFDEVLGRIGTHVESAPELSVEGAGGLFAACVVRIGEEETAGHIAIVLPTAAIELASEPPVRESVEPLAEAAVANVEVELVAELGSVRIPLARLAALKVGDVVRLPLAVDTAARLHVGGRGLLAGRPTTRGAQIAIAVERHGD